ncbi:MAG: DUF4340 domain-containing protein, partial [Candidatus Hydrogenedentes bacterium]|nr:DUF4340 domain-containing protein [Candidatus Hydrogenedentota bacterium]
MKFRNTIQLGAALVLLVALYFGQQLLERKSDEMVQEAKKVFSFTLEDIHTLTIHRLDEAPTVGVRQEDGSWAITEPNPAIRAYDTLWDRVAEHLAALKDERTLPGDAMDLDTYGLTVPRLTIMAEAAGKEFTLRFGYLEPTQSYRYAQLDGGAVFLVSKDVVFELDRPLNLLRDSFVVTDREAPIVRLEYARYMSVAEAERSERPDRLG